RPASPPPRQAPPPPKPAPRQAAPAQTAPPPAAAGETFVVQVFSTHDEPQAVKLQQRLQQMRYRAFMSTIDVGGQTMYRVRIGPFTERNRAEKVKIDVRNQLKLDPWVTAASN
ncbi:MAG: SPOR domain-containing protein, partial [Acidobacteriota bacterium]